MDKDQLKEDIYYGMIDPPEGEAQASPKQQAERIELDVRTVCSTLCGRRFLNHLMKVFGQGTNPFTAGHTDATFFKLGQHEAAAYIDAVLRATDKGVYAKMVKEELAGKYGYSKAYVTAEEVTKIAKKQRREKGK